MIEEELTLIQYGDKELWYIKGHIPEGEWAIPLWVKRYKSGEHEYVMATPISILGFQSEKVEELFYSKAVWKNNGSYVLEEKDFLKHAHKAPGVTPDFYRKWPGMEGGVPKDQQLQVSSWKTAEPSGNTKFLKYLSDKRGISYNLIKLVWWSICEEGPNWMMGERKPIDLGFVVLYPMPFRPNWKDIMLSKNPTVSPAFSLPSSERDRELTENGFLGDICSGQNLAISPKVHTINWCVEAVTQKSWQEENDRIESIRISGGKDKYITIYERIIKAIVPSVFEAFGTYLSKIALPFAEVYYSRGGGGRNMVPYRGVGMRKKALLNYSCSIVVNDKAVSFSNKGKQEDLHPETFELPEVSNLSSWSDDLRGPEEHDVLDQPSYEPDRTIGLSVPHAVQGEAPGEPMLPKSNGEGGLG